MKKNEIQINSAFVAEIKAIILQAQQHAIRSVDFYRVQMYWQMGERIFNEELGGKDRADYGTSLIRNLAKEIEPIFGSGFSYRQLNWCRQFYRTYPIVSALRTQFNWSQYKMFIGISDASEREFYEHECLKNAWNGRELERQIQSSLYQRLLLSSNKEAVLSVARKERQPEYPHEIIKNPMVLEFLGLEKKPEYYEFDLETALIVHLQQFMLELGNGFAFMARQKRLLIDDDEFFADLVFYNRLLRCFVIIEIKTKKLTHQDLGQLQMYVNYYDRYEKLEDEKPTIGILLCASQNKSLVELTLPQEANIYASEYTLYLPDKLLLQQKLAEWVKEFDGRENKLE